MEDKVFQDLLTPGLGKHILNHFLAAKNVRVPHMVQTKIFFLLNDGLLQFVLDLELSQHVFPVLWFHAVVPKLIEELVEFLVLDDILFVGLVHLVLTRLVGELAHFVLGGVQDFLDLGFNVVREGCGVYLLDVLPDTAHF